MPFQLREPRQPFQGWKTDLYQVQLLCHQKDQIPVEPYRGNQKDGRLLIPKFYGHNMDMDDNRLILSILKENGFTVHLMDDMEILTEPVEPTAELIRKKTYWKEFTDEEMKEELEKAMDSYNEKLETFKNASGHGYAIGTLVDPKTYLWEEVLMKEEEAVSY